MHNVLQLILCKINYRYITMVRYIISYVTSGWNTYKRIMRGGPMQKVLTFKVPATKAAPVGKTATVKKPGEIPQQYSDAVFLAMLNKLTLDERAELKGYIAAMIAGF